MGTNYEQLSRSERDQIFLLHAEGISEREIGRRLERHHSTINKELRRNRSEAGYLPDTAHRKARKRCYRGRFKIDRHPLLKSALLDGLALGWSPEQIAGRLGFGNETPNICPETIYRYLYHSPFARKRQLTDFLCRAQPRRRPRKGRKRRKSNIPNRISIHERPENIMQRLESDHWEADLMLFSNTKASLSTAIERQSRYAILRLNPEGKRSKPVVKRLKKALKPHRPKSVTLDNGMEFAAHENIHKIGTQTYFCDPYSSWQKGSVENLNGILRRHLPRNLPPEKLTQNMLDKLQNLINNTPRKILGFKTPAEIFNCRSSI
jgi:IS30 family transposase